MSLNRKTLCISGAIILLITIPLWCRYIVPWLEKLPSDFRYQAEVISHDNFYDEAKRVFSGEIHSKTTFYYDLVSQQAGVYLIENVFDVRTPNDRPIFAVERLYGIDPSTGKHVPGYGDKDREGYLFAPRHLHKQDYVYWHINYDAPATMKFQGEEDILGLRVYRYESNYSVDQTANLGHLLGVPSVRGVNLDIRLQVWVEPEMGRMIKYQDDTIAYYYDIHTGHRLNPWNKFGNTFKPESIAAQVQAAKSEKIRMLFMKMLMPIVLAGVAVLLLAVPFIRHRSSSIPPHAIR